MKRIKRLASTLLALAMVAVLLPVSTAAADRTISGNGVQPQMLAGGVVKAVATGTSNYSFGDTIYYPLREGSTDIMGSGDLTPLQYTLAYEQAAGERFSPVSSLEMVYLPHSSGSSKWFLKITFVSEPVDNYQDFTVTGVYTITPSGGTKFSLKQSLTTWPVVLKTQNVAPVDKTIYSIATQAQAKGSDGVITTLDKTGCQMLQYGDVIYYAIRSSSSSSSYLTGAADLTPAKYTCGYTPSASESINAVKAVELVYDKNTSTASRWWIKITLIDKPTNAAAKLDLNGTFTITAASPATNVSMAPKDGNFPLAVVSVKTDTPVTNLGTQAQGMGTDGYIAVLSKSNCSALEYGSVIYYPVRTGSSTNIVGIDELTPAKYTCTYTKGSETINPVKSVELVHAPTSATASRWWIKITFIDKPANPPETLAVDGSFRIASSDLGIDVTMAPKSGSYPLALVAQVLSGKEKIATKTSTAPQYVKEGETLIAQNGTSSTSSIFGFGQTIYFLLRDNVGDIISPDYIVPADYSIACDSAQVSSVELVPGKYIGGERWYVKLVMAAQAGTENEVNVMGTVSIAHKSGEKAVLDLTARGILLTADTSPRPFTRVATWAQRANAEGVVKSISGASSTSPTVEYGEAIYYALAFGSNTALTDISLLDPGDYDVVYTPAKQNDFDPFAYLELSYEPYETTTAKGSRWFLKLQTSEEPQGLMLADGLIEVFRQSDRKLIASLDLGANVPLIFSGEDDTTNNRGVRTVTLVHHVDSVKMVENEEGYVGRATSDLGASSNVGYGETIYYMLVGVDRFGGTHPITEPDAVENIRIKTKFEQNEDKIESIEIVKKRSIAYGKRGFYYFLSINIIDKPTWVSRYTLFGDIILEKKGKYGITNTNNECTLFIDTVVGPEKTHSRVDVTDEDELRRLSDTYRRFEFSDSALGSSPEDVFYFYGMNDDNYFTVSTRDQGNILLGNNVEYNEEVGARYSDAELFFFNGGVSEFNHHGIMTFSAAPSTYLYARNGSMLTRISGLKYDEDENAYRFYTRRIGNYVFSDRELDYDRYNIARVAPWAQSENEDGSISTINGCELKGPYVEYGSTVYYALRNDEDKTITDQMAIDPANFTYGFEASNRNGLAVKEAGINFRTNLIKSTDSRTDRYYLTVNFAEVPDPGVPRKVSGDLIVYYKGEELTRLVLGPTEKGDYTITLHGGRPVENDWIPYDYVAPELKTEEEISSLPTATLLDGESELDTGTAGDVSQGSSEDGSVNADDSSSSPESSSEPSGDVDE